MYAACIYVFVFSKIKIKTKKKIPVVVHFFKKNETKLFPWQAFIAMNISYKSEKSRHKAFYDKKAMVKSLHTAPAVLAT